MPWRKSRALIGPATIMVSPNNELQYLRSLGAVRERCNQVFTKVLDGKSKHFTLHMDKMSQVVQYIVRIIKRDYGSNIASIPPHGRWQHFGSKRLDPLIASLAGTAVDKTRALTDLFVVSVLLDAGAGDRWSYYDQGTDERVERSEGLAVASLRMFEDGLFSAESDPYRVDAAKLQRLTLAQLARGLQHSADNLLTALEGRLQLLHRLGQALADKPQYFAGQRPGNLVDCLLARSSHAVDVEHLWDIVIDGFGAVWPDSRAKLGDIPLGDVWPCALLPASQDLVPFHKLSQWLAFSILQPIAHFLGIRIHGIEKMTGLAEYRNGGLFVDLGVLALASDVDKVSVADELVVEWRALTVVLLDRTAAMLRKELAATESELTLPMVLEAGTWKAGREIAATLRPDTKGPPIRIVSDGTVF